jgi:hypothetical protein
VDHFEIRRLRRTGEGEGKGARRQRGGHASVSHFDSSQNSETLQIFDKANTEPTQPSLSGSREVFSERE